MSVEARIGRADRITHDLLNQILAALQALVVPPAPVSEAFPVGSIYTTVLNANPAAILGYGTWEFFGSGRTLVGRDVSQAEFDAVEKIGGAKQHTLTVNELPSHAHPLPSRTLGTGSQTTYEHGALDPSSEATDEGAVGTAAVGGDQPHNNLQPYVVVNFWKRTI